LSDRGGRPCPPDTRAPRHPGPHEVGTAPLLRRRGGGVVADATAPEARQGRRATRALTRFVPGGPCPPDNRAPGTQGPHAVGTAPLLRRRGGRVVANATTPESRQGRRATRALTRFVPGGRCRPDNRPPAAHGPHAVGTAPVVRRSGGWFVACATTCESRQGRRAKRALTRFVPGGPCPPDRRTPQTNS